MLTFVGAVRREAGRGGDPARAAARGAGLLPAQPGRVDRPRGQAARRAGARGAHRHRPRADDRGRARAGHGRVLGEGLRRPRQHHDRRERPRHPERQHADRRAGRRFGLSPAAPDPRARRPRPRARLRLLHLPAREAADGARARPARDDRAEHRDRRRHGGRDEGPRDPRRRQPARRRAGRPHRRASASTSTCGWSARPSATSRRAAPCRARTVEEVLETKVDLPIDAHLPHAYVPGERLRLEAYRRLAAGERRGRDRRRPRRAGRPVRPAAGAGREPAGGRRLPGPRQDLRPHRGDAAGRRTSASRPCSCARARRCGCSGSTRARWSSPPSARCWFPSR